MSHSVHQQCLRDIQSSHRQLFTAKTKLSIQLSIEQFARSNGKVFLKKANKCPNSLFRSFQTFHQIFNQTFNLLRPKVLWLLHPHWAFRHFPSKGSSFLSTKKYEKLVHNRCARCKLCNSLAILIILTLLSPDPLTNLEISKILWDLKILRDLQILRDLKNIPLTLFTMLALLTVLIMLTLLTMVDTVDTD